jgi:hypothetical protein
MNLADLNQFVAKKWDDDLVPRLVEYVRVPQNRRHSTAAGMRTGICTQS